MLGTQANFMHLTFSWPVEPTARFCTAGLNSDQLGVLCLDVNKRLLHACVHIQILQTAARGGEAQIVKFRIARRVRMVKFRIAIEGTNAQVPGGNCLSSEGRQG